MIEQPPSLTPQDIAAMQTAQYADLGQPQTVKVFGIMHVILAVYGFGTLVLGVITTFVGNPVYNFMPKTPELTKQMAMEAQMQDQMRVVTVLGLVMALVLSILILIAGIKLLQKRRGGLVWSNRYAWASLAGKAIALVLTFLYTIPAMREMAVDPALPAAAQSIMRTSMVVGAVLGVVGTCIYPILSLILLNRPKTKEWFANRPD
jgi:hypothetical protein